MSGTGETEVTEADCSPLRSSEPSEGRRQCTDIAIQYDRCHERRTP